MTPGQPGRDILAQAVAARLSPKRYRHSLAVQKRAVYLASIHGGDPEKASAAGLAHDICKEMPEADQLNYLRRCGILLDIWTLAHPPVWHAITGAEYLRRELGVADGEILCAVRYHSTGRAEMTLLDKIIYVADLTSEDRSFPDVEHVRALSVQSLDEAVGYSVGFIVEQLIQERQPLVGDAWEAYNQYSANSAKINRMKEPEV